MEELEDRYGDQMEDILTAVKTSLKDTSPAVNGASAAAQSAQVEATFTEYAEDYAQDAEHWDYNANEVVFDDTGEGAGIEGDLDVDDDS